MNVSMKRTNELSMGLSATMAESYYGKDAILADGGCAVLARMLNLGTVFFTVSENSREINEHIVDVVRFAVKTEFAQRKLGLTGVHRDAHSALGNQKWLATHGVDVELRVVSAAIAVNDPERAAHVAARVEERELEERMGMSTAEAGRARRANAGL